MKRDKRGNERLACKFHLVALVRETIACFIQAKRVTWAAYLPGTLTRFYAKGEGGRKRDLL